MRLGRGRGHWGHKGVPGRRGGSAPGSGGGGGLPNVNPTTSTISEATESLRKYFNAPKDKFPDLPGPKHISLGRKTPLEDIYGKLETIGFKRIKKPDYAQKFDAAWFKLENRTARVLTGQAIRGGEEDRSLVIFDD